MSFTYDLANFIPFRDLIYGDEFCQGIRNGNELACYLPDKRTVLVEKRSEQNPLLGIVNYSRGLTEGVRDNTIEIDVCLRF